MKSTLTRRRAVVVGAVAFVLCLSLGCYPDVAQARCPERPRCSSCGCKGGPGYRGPDGRCVGFKDLAKVCGTPPESRCVFENAPGTGLNLDCAWSPEWRGKID